MRPTLLELAGLKDDYGHDGRVLFEVLQDASLARALRGHQETLSELASAYKAINAPVGELGRKTLQLSTTALAGDDATFAALEQQINDLSARRNAIAGRMIAILEGAAFDNLPVDENEAAQLIGAAQDLLQSID